METCRKRRLRLPRTRAWRNLKERLSQLEAEKKSLVADIGQKRLELVHKKSIYQWERIDREKGFLFSRQLISKIDDAIIFFKAKLDLATFSDGRISSQHIGLVGANLCFGNDNYVQYRIKL